MANVEQSLGARQPARLESELVRTIVPAKRRIRLSDLRRDFPVIGILASRDFKIKYKQSILGPLWIAFQPLALLAGFLVAFRGHSAIAPGVPYIVFALTGLMVWSFFQAAMIIGTSSLITNAQLVRFTPCPRLAFPVAGMIASVPSLIVPAAGALIATAIAGTLPPRVVLLPLAFAWLFLLCFGIIAFSSALAVRFRDIISMLPFALSVGLFLAPVGYSLVGLSPWLRALIDLNPLTGVLEASRWMAISRYHPSIPAMAISFGATAAAVVFGWWVFSRFETSMADVI